MNRRKLLRDLAFASPALMLLPTLLDSCRKDPILPKNPYKGDVIIIGAGASGIYAANLLRKQGIQVTILEANSDSGGRIRADYSFTDFAFELGADKFKGKRSIFYDLASYHLPDSILPYSGTNFFLLDNLLRTEYFLKENAGLGGAGASLFQTLESFASYPGGETTVFQYLNDLPIENRFHPIANALVGNDLGADNKLLGMMAMKERSSAASSGTDQYFLKNKSYWNIFEKAFPDEISSTLRQRIATKITYNASGVKVETKNGEVYQAGRLLLTVPLGVLKKSMIQFDPALPSSKLSAIDQIGFGKGFRIALRFSQPFWLSGTDLIMGGSIVPQYEISSTNRSAYQHVVSGTVMGEAAEELEGFSDQEIASKAVTELAKLYPSGAVLGKYSQEYLVHNWATEPYIQGSYSYPSPGSEGRRKELAAPVAGKIFFAGEATNDNGHSGTVHGAMESAYRSVAEILNS